MSHMATHEESSVSRFLPNPKSLAVSGSAFYINFNCVLPFYCVVVDCRLPIQVDRPNFLVLSLG